MAETLLAWTFDPEALHRWLVPQTVVDGRLSLPGLLTAAKKAWELDTPVVDDYLSALALDRNDPESWEPIFSPEPDVDVSEELYAVAIGHQVQAAQHFSPWSHVLLGIAAKRMGVQGDPSQLWTGHGLSTLAASSGNDAFARAFSRTRSSLGGWLPLSEAEKQLTLLRSLDAIELPDDIGRWFTGSWFETLPLDELSSRIRTATREAVTLVETAVARNRALRVVLWS